MRYWFAVCHECWLLTRRIHAALCERLEAER